MKHALRTALGAGFLLASVAAMAQVAEAGTLTIQRNPLYQGANGGGEFKVATFSGGSVPAQGAQVNVFGGVFQTFCLERNEHLDFQGQQINWAYNTVAINGGVAGGNPDPLDSRTAYLYGRFWDGSLDSEGYDYTPGAARRASATALQLAIWYFEEELGADAAHGVADIHAAYNSNALAQHFVGLANTNDPGTIGRVRVLNLTRDDQHGLLHQDVLVLVPLPSAALLGLGLMSGAGAFEFIRRRRRNFA